MEGLGRRIALAAVVAAGVTGMAGAAPLAALGASTGRAQPLAATPPMGWNDWAHYQCGYTAKTILANARALVKTGLAADGYNTVTIDDCWMRKTRDSQGNLQADPHRFPHGMKPVAEAIHKMGLKFGVYEDAGYATCDGLAGSGEVKGGGRNYFDQDARLFASWGVDYLKLDGCNLYVPPGSTEEATYRKAYSEEAAALKKVDRPIIFSESAPAYFQGSPAWYSVLGWIGSYGQLWREGTDIEIRKASQPDRPRFGSVLWNYGYNLPLGRFQHPGNWNDADFIIGGDTGLTLAESRSQMALWAMMSAPLILSSNLAKQSAASLAVLGNRRIIAVDQDPLGRMATLVSHSPRMDVLLKRLAGGADAVAVFDRGSEPIRVTLSPQDLGFDPNSNCRFQAEDLWTGTSEAAAPTLGMAVQPHDTAIWRIQPTATCGQPAGVGAITMENNTTTLDSGARPWATYTRCLVSPGNLEACVGSRAERWTVAASGTIQSDGQCLTLDHGKPSVGACDAGLAEQWSYTRLGEVVNQSDHECLTAPDGKNSAVEMRPCSNFSNAQIWSLPN